MTDSFLDVREGILAQVRDYEATRRRDLTLDRVNPVSVREPESSMRVALSDADATGQVPLERVMAMMMSQRHAHVAQFYGLDLALQSKRDKRAWCAADASCMLLRPVRALESLRIRSGVLDVTSDHVRVEVVLLDAPGRALKAIMHATQIWTDLTSGQPVAHPPLLLALLRQVQVGSGRSLLAYRTR